ncbi:hypothetical protein BCT63_19120 [Vibrio kanaloae]|uniref:Uncharacterized protein n=1 Tax=Vibrio kanaloae TaxID=170673 RepID=A0A2N7J778_9VIBR|nr:MULTISPECIES: hypothetical protein [Vibrio]KAB0463938.1 hypothetical protein F7Q89_10800 [Vibrio kanaloae]MCG9559146.1 hypothetical protein [Vibrio kanaloae]PMM01426.1 hypothetical protein BCT63_19120 [Vibrio kanaloae]TKF01087.1 hypothetical protein FCV46_17105 [Vibrio kanaloae]TKF25662.1 hypothetical protein FCV50_21960 [Vibrio kanaloae]
MSAPEYISDLKKVNAKNFIFISAGILSNDYSDCKRFTVLLTIIFRNFYPFISLGNGLYHPARKRLVMSYHKKELVIRPLEFRMAV